MPSTSFGPWTWVPRLVRSKATKMEEGPQGGPRPCGRPPTDVELATVLGLPMEEFEKMAMDANAVLELISLNKKWYETDSYKEMCVKSIAPQRRQEGRGADPAATAQDLMRMVTKGTGP